LGIISFLVVFPLVAAGFLLVTKNDRVRGVIVTAAAGIIAAASFVLAAQSLTAPGQLIVFESEAASLLGLAVSLALGLYVLGMSVKHKKPLAGALALVQIGAVLALELFAAHGVAIEHSLCIDTFSVVMALVIGVIGSGICVYALGYMRDFAHHHPEQKDRRPVFFAVMFAFLSGMFVIVFSNSLMWLLTGWEVTTVCSFALIAYTRTGEAVKNAFLQITMNLLGGIAFTLALIYSALELHTLELDGLIAAGLGGAAVALPVMLLAFAGMTKAAQMPFQSWLLGAMVAPTPTSALLHSSTMVKAGVFLLVKLSPLLGMTAVSGGGWNVPGITVMTVGGLTFLLCSLMAITQSNAKRVLAYSTIANLGLITACAGVGTAEAVWAAVFLIIFHAAAKSLLFLCVGTAEHRIGSRDIESFDGLFTSRPWLARMMALGIAGMFIAPFGMLVSKWAAFAAFLDSGNLALVLMLVFGSAATFLFWAKWLGKIIAVAGAGGGAGDAGGAGRDGGAVSLSERSAILLMGALTAGIAAAFPLVSSAVVAPYLDEMFGASALPLGAGDLLIMAGTVALMLLVLAPALASPRAAARDLPVYMSGVGLYGASGADVSFAGSLGAPVAAAQRNWYLEGLLSEKKLGLAGVALASILLALGLAVSAIVTGVM